MITKNYSFYRCCLEMGMAREGDPGWLAATEVVQAVCSAGFRENGFLMKSYPLIPQYYFKYAKTPREGMFMLRVVKKTDMTSLDILIDTRIYPNMIMMEQHKDWTEEADEVRNALECFINDAAEKQKWRICLEEHRPGATQNLAEFLSALKYLENDDYMTEKHHGGVHIDQLIKVNGNYYYNDIVRTADAESGADETQPADRDSDLVDELKPLFYNNMDNVRQFLNEIDGMTPNDITDLVNQWVKDKRISDYGNSRKGVLWDILNRAGLYTKSRQNWNRRVY